MKLYEKQTNKTITNFQMHQKNVYNLKWLSIMYKNKYKPYKMRKRKKEKLFEFLINEQKIMR